MLLSQLHLGEGSTLSLHPTLTIRVTRNALAMSHSHKRGSRLTKMCHFEAILRNYMFWLQQRGLHIHRILTRLQESIFGANVPYLLMQFLGHCSIWDSGHIVNVRPTAFFDATSSPCVAIQKSAYWPLNGSGGGYNWIDGQFSRGVPDTLLKWLKLSE